ncbi:MAG: hypothetical protein R2728_04160 [Chitinophagales bacterium]
MVDFEHHAQHVLFDGSTEENLKATNEWNRRSHLGLGEIGITFFQLCLLHFPAC